MWREAHGGGEGEGEGEGKGEVEHEMIGEANGLDQSTYTYTHLCLVHWLAVALANRHIDQTIARSSDNASLDISRRHTPYCTAGVG